MDRGQIQRLIGVTRSDRKMENQVLRWREPYKTPFGALVTEITGIEVTEIAQRDKERFFGVAQVSAHKVPRRLLNTAESAIWNIADLPSKTKRVEVMYTGTGEWTEVFHY